MCYYSICIKGYNVKYPIFIFSTCVIVIELSPQSLDWANPSCLSQMKGYQASRLKTITSIFYSISIYTYQSIIWAVIITALDLQHLQHARCQAWGTSHYPCRSRASAQFDTSPLPANTNDVNSHAKPHSTLMSPDLHQSLTPINNE